MFGNQSIKSKAARLEDRSIILEGEIIGAQLVIADYTDKQFYIRVMDKDDYNSYLAQVEMSGDMLEYFQTELQSTVQILLQWKLSFDN